MVGLLPTAPPVPLAFQQPGRTVMLLGGAGVCDTLRFGGTQYAKAIVQQLWGLPPALDMEYEKAVQAAIREIVRTGLAESVHDLSDGGLAVALAESSQAGMGADIRLDADLPPEILLFHEAPSRVLLSTSVPERAREIAAQHGVEALVIGETVENRLEIRNRGVLLGAWALDELREAYEGAMERYV
jgi:phosphoribosylformylglycinamidine synthase